MRAWFSRATPWLLPLVLTACASQPPAIETSTDWATHRAQLEATTFWTLQGKLALRSDERSETASLAWTQAGERADLRMSGPLGAGATRVTSDGQVLRVARDGRSDLYDISSPEAITRSTGFNLPIKALPHWVKGVPAPAPAASDLILERGQLQSFEQAGWRVSYADYRNIDGLALPSRVTLENADTRARLIVSRWTLDAQP